MKRSVRLPCAPPVHDVRWDNRTARWTRTSSTCHLTRCAACGNFLDALERDGSFRVALKVGVGAQARQHADRERRQRARKEVREWPRKVRNWLRNLQPISTGTGSETGGSRETMQHPDNGRTVPQRLVKYVVERQIQQTYREILAR